MPLLPVESQSENASSKSAKAAAEIDLALRTARKRLRAQRMVRLTLATLPYVIAATAAWLAFTRFTLIDLPLWPVALGIAAWAVLLVIRAVRLRISPGESARYLDHALSLDERVGTLVELVRAAPVRGLTPVAVAVPAGLLEDTAFHVKSRLPNLPAAHAVWPGNSRLIALALALLALAAAWTLPSPFDQVRADRAALQRTVTAELNQIAGMKAEAVARPGLTDQDRQSIIDQLDALSQSLSDPNLDRSALLAALSDAQQKIQQLSPQTTADFDNLIAAARNMQQATVNASRGGALGSELAWNPDDYPELSDLGKAAAAADALSPRVRTLSSNQTTIVVPFLEQASTQAASDDSELGQALLDASRAVGAKDVEKAGSALQQVSARFQEADHRWQLTQSVEKIMSGLDDSRQSLAQVGNPQAQKKQVGFRRPGAQNSTQAQNAPGGTRTGDTQNSTPGTGSDQNSAQTAPSAFGAPMGSNSPDYRSLNNASTAGGSQSSGQPSTQGGSGSPSQPGTSGSAGAGQPGAGSSSSGDGTQGTFTGQIAGPVGGGSGAISRVPNPQGQGLAEAAQGQQPGLPQSDSVYVPPAEPSAPAPEASGGSMPGQAAPAQQPDGIEGRSSGGGDGQQTPADKGAGTRNQIRTPYKEVIGHYAQQATQALEQQYVPADAKEYVKDYFAQLGK